jgi:hypothetical protein
VRKEMKEGKIKMRVLDLFSGLGGWSQAFKDRGHEVVTVDINPKFNPTIVADVMNLTPKDFEKYGQFDIILASPPCNCFSVASVYRHWDKDTKRPKDEETRHAIRLVGHTIWLILNLQPRWWILENPRGMMRKVLGKPVVTTYFASWQTENDNRKPVFKATDLWGVIPEGIKWKKPKTWQDAPRGARTGTQGIKDAELRAKIPYGLSLAVCLACERELKSINFSKKLVSE